MFSKATTHSGQKIGSERWTLLMDILADALEQSSAAARAALLDTRCADDEVLRAEAQSLISEMEASLHAPSDALEECAEHATATLWQEHEAGQGRRIGAYLVVAEIGRGGMGTVYLAARADGQFEKEVAIKVLKRGTDTEEVLRRFASERHILARLDHPNIARLLDAGTTEDGLPYFVMEYVAGAPVTRYAREHELPIQQRLAIFLKICAAVEVAHHKHVIHRDLKPSNILVNEEGEPKLLDFGIAKLLTPGQESVERTATGQERLTPSCASPEQTDGRAVTEASDVYALGALLYELLSGQKPHKFSNDHPSGDEIARVVRDEEPVAPSSVAQQPETSRLLRGNLDAVTLKALRKDPASRYATVADFAGDIRRHLADQPVLARRLGAKDRVRVFFSRHHRRLVGALAVLVIAALAVSLWMNSQQTRRVRVSAPNESSPSADLSKSIAVLPFDNFGDDNPAYFADGVQDNILTDLGKVGDLKVVSRNAVAGYRGKAPNAQEIGRDLTVGSVLVGSVQKSGERVRINAQLIDTRTDTQIWAEHYDRKVEDIFALQSELAETIVRQLKATLSSGEAAAIRKRSTGNLAAYDLYLRARALYSTVPAPNPRPEWHEVVSLARAALERDPKFTRAWCLLSEVELLIYRYGDDHTTARLASAKEAAETALRLEPDLEEARLGLARYFYYGLHDYERTEEELAKVPAAGGHNVELHSLASLAERRRGKWEESIRDSERAIELDPQNHELVVNLAQTLNALRRYAEANRVIDAAISRKRGASTPRLAIAKHVAAIGIGDLAAARSALDTFPEWDAMDYEYARTWLCVLERDYARARRTAEGAAGAFREVANFWLIRATIAKGEGKAEEARQANEEAKHVAERIAANRPDDPEPLGELSVATARVGLREEAVVIAQRAIAMVPPAADALVAPYCMQELAEVLTLKGDRDGAFEALGRAIRMPYGMNYGDLTFDPAWDVLRGDPRFDQLLAESRIPF